MRFDAGNPADRAAFGRPFDVCVIGTGPAGTTLARQLAARGLDVALMEAGGLEWSEESQDVTRGTSVGILYPDLDVARLRFLGGNSNHWNGLCRAFDATDFEARPANPDAAWPIGRADLDPYTDAVHDILDLTPIDDGDPNPGTEPSTGFRRIHYFRSAPTRFGEKYLDELTASERISLCLNANLVDIRLDDALGTVTGAHFKGYARDDSGFTVQARAYALCCGGIENPRLLLNFRSQIPAGIGNQNDLVGRYYNDHPGTPPPLGEVIFTGQPLADAQFFEPTEALMAELGSMPMNVRINYASDRKPLPFGKELARTLQCAVPYADRLTDAVLGDALTCGLGGGVEDWWHSRDGVRWPWGRVAFNAQAALNRDSRVMLSDEVDAFGMNRVKLDWRVQPVDNASIRETIQAFAGWLAEEDIGRMKIYDWVLTDTPIEVASSGTESMSSWHHMCGTRMATDPKMGVVDADCRVHGVSNLYIGGSSVFSSSGFVNPTYTIVQLALRLGDHLGETLPAAATPATTTPATTTTPAGVPEAPAAPEGSKP
jgi:choline dehydrogenase-like flavoprotein